MIDVNPLATVRPRVQIQAGGTEEIQKQLGDAHEQNDNTSYQSGKNTNDESVVVPCANTMIQPLAMMVELLDTFVANRTMFGFVVDDIDVAQVTVAVFDDMTELAPVEFRHDDVSTHVEQVGIAGINNNRHNVADNMDEIQATDDAIHEWLNRRVQGGN